ncbi:MAG: DUF2141 domain-containing protein [Candidatus Aminicenantes bacterium]|nr:DUF2141 domain-containing protein [Candidatus Aminicenantes bacterium]
MRFFKRKQVRLVMFSGLLLLTFSIGKINAALVHSVSGEVSAKGQGRIHLFLLTCEQFKADDESAALHLVVDPGSSGQAVPFHFAQVAPGEYGIRCYQDENNNGKLDFGTFGPKEPWGMSHNKRPFMRSPRFEEICFQVDADIDKLMIKVK